MGVEVVLIRELDKDVLIKGGVRAAGDVTLDEEWQAELVHATAAGEAVVVEERPLRGPFG